MQNVADCSKGAHTAQAKALLFLLTEQNMNCPSCGANLPDGVNFCGVCGSDLRALVSDSSLAKTVMLDAPIVFDEEEHEAPDGAIDVTQREVDATVPESNLAPVQENLNAMRTTPDLVSDPVEEEVFQDAEQATKNVVENKGSDMSDNKGQDGDAQQPQEKAENNSGGAEQPAADGNQGGGFRETLWFMQAQDPESLEAIENIDLQARREAYDDDGSALDTSVRQQFSLNPNSSPTQQQSQTGGGQKPGSEKLVHFEEESRNKKLIAGGLVAVIIILVAIILMK